MSEVPALTRPFLRKLASLCDEHSVVCVDYRGGPVRGEPVEGAPDRRVHHLNLMFACPWDQETKAKMRTPTAADMWATYYA